MLYEVITQLMQRHCRGAALSGRSGVASMTSKCSAVAPQIGQQSGGSVITSYSIHYTKLYELLDHAAEYGYGIPAFNVNNLEQMRAIMEAASKTDSPVIVQASAGARKYAGSNFLKHMIVITSYSIHYTKLYEILSGTRS